ncbi:hypothetical protein [Helicobacter cetorum]|uniref:Integrase n=1 Tax=Helicobacter cetorum (strain ATCC BAA-540 / CCUG 52418 / MIT 99-5656) TaxID=1163745 RepID=I0EUF9_HELCM|nr:hypothetical protein [Helicobacter cetorum]AFI06578.1 hypothetical protein HCD_07970 [Helicobacter cetorum MIT 99-5656]
MKFFKIPKLHLNPKECQEMFLDNVKFAKKTKNFYFKDKEDIDVEIFKKAVHDRFYSTLFGGVGSRRLYRELCEIALSSKSNKIALSRHYYTQVHQCVDRSLRNAINDLEAQGLIEAIRNKPGYVYIYLKDFTKNKEFQGSNFGKSNIPSPFFLKMINFLQKNAQRLKSVQYKVNNQICELKEIAFSKFRQYNDLLFSFSPLNDTQTSFTLNYKALSKKAIPSNKCPYQKAIVLKNLQRAFNKLVFKNKDFRMCA